MSEAARLRAIAAAAAAAAERWTLPAVEGPLVGQRRSAASDARLAADRARGYEEGLAAGRAEMQRQIEELGARVQRLDAVVGALARPLESLDQAFEQQLVLLALAIGRQLARRELRADPSQLIAVIRDAVGRLPAAARDVRVHLHPEDAAVVRERLAAPAQERAWTLVEDPTLSRGGCLVRTDSSQVDARLESRVQAIASELLGDERSSGRADAAADGKAEP